MRSHIPLLFPEGFVRLRRALDFWENGARWDCEGLNWPKVRDHPHRLRNSLVNGALTAFVMTEQGRLDAVPPDPWRGNYLWGEAYETSLVKVDLNRGRVDGYLLIKRQDVEDLWRLKDQEDRPSPSIRAQTVDAIMDKCPTIGLVVRASVDDIGRSSEKEVELWLRSSWPLSLQEAWPERDTPFPPSIARQINIVIRKLGSVAVTWAGPEPSDKEVAELANAIPLLGAAMQVFLRARSGDFDYGPSRMVLPKRVQDEMRNLLKETAQTDGASQLFKALAKLAIPHDKVSGGGRRKKQQTRGLLRSNRP